MFTIPLNITCFQSLYWFPVWFVLLKNVHFQVHLFDINIPNSITFRESETLSPGDKFTTFDVMGCKVGLGICYDIRFAEMAQAYTKMGKNPWHVNPFIHTFYLLVFNNVPSLLPSKIKDG